MSYYNPKKPISTTIDLFVKSRINQNLRTATIRRYHTTLTYYYKITQEDIVTYESITKFTIYIRDTGIAQKTYNGYLENVKTYARWLYKRRFINDIAFLDDFKGYKSPEKVWEKKAYDEETIKRFLTEIESPKWLHYFLFLGFRWGLRPSEIYRLDITDINLKDRYINIRPAVAKTHKAAKLPIHNKFMGEMRELMMWRVRHAKDMVIKQLHKHPDVEKHYGTKIAIPEAINLGLIKPYLLVTRDGSRIKEENVNLHKHKMRAIDPEFRPYFMRYTVAWNTYKNTNNIYTVQKLLRHASTEKTMLYLDVAEDEQLNQLRDELEYAFINV